MAISEHDRYELQKRLVEDAGERVAETVTAPPPPVGWADAATKLDREHVETSLRSELRAHLALVVGLDISSASAVIALPR